MILLHILIALSSLATTTSLAIWPSARKMKLSMVLIGLTLATGTYLVISLHTSMLRACATGLIYLAIALTGVVVGQRRLAHATVTEREE